MLSINFKMGWITMNVKRLNDEEIIEVYKKHMVVDFPVEELKPLEVIQKLLKKENYMCYGFYDNKELLAYVFLVSLKSYLLIDYYAVCSKYRDRGIGSEFLTALKEKCSDFKGIIVEVEKVEDAQDESEKIIRKRRISFYEKNGMRITSISSELFGVNYSIMCLCNIEIDDSYIFEVLEKIYMEITPVKLYSKYVKIKKEIE